VKENKPKDWKEKINVFFERSPQLKSCIKNPIFFSDAFWARDASKVFFEKNGGSSGDDYYRLVFKKGTSGSLMTIGRGELSALKTTTIVEKGKIAGTAGLERVEIPTASNFLPRLLMESMFGVIQNHLGYISNLCEDIRNRQIIGDYAKLERISEVIVNCFESIPEMDQCMMRLNLERIMRNTDECHDLLIIMREELTKESKAKAENFRSDHCHYFAHLVSHVEAMMKHNVFAAYERFVAGNICQIVLSGNYSANNIEQSKQSVIRVKESLCKVFERHVDAPKRCIDDLHHMVKEIEDGNRPSSWNGWNISNLKEEISKSESDVANIEKKLYALLDAKLESFDFLLQLATKDEIEIYLVNGAIIVNEQSSVLPESQSPRSSALNQMPK